MPKRLTNVEFVTELMEFSRYGALAQMFIIDAIHKHAQAVSQAKPEQVESAMISGEAWIGVAKDIRNRLEEHFDNRPQRQDRMDSKPD